MPYAIFSLICLVWSVSFLLMKKAAEVYSPATVGFGRVFGGVLILAVIWLWRRESSSIRKGDWPLITLVAIVGFGWPFFIQPVVISRQGSAFMAMVISLVPLLTVVLSFFMLSVRPTWRQLLGVLGALVCMAILMADGWRRAIPVSQLALATSVPLAYALTNVVIRARLRHISALDLTLAALSVSALCLLPVALTSPAPSPTKTASATLALGCLAFLGLVSTGVGNALFNKLIREHGPLFAGMTTNVVPLGAVIWGWLDHEAVSPAQLVALAGIVAMVTLVQTGAAGGAGDRSEN